MQAQAKPSWVLLMKTSGLKHRGHSCGIQSARTPLDARAGPNLPEAYAVVRLVPLLRPAASASVTDLIQSSKAAPGGCF